MRAKVPFRPTLSPRHQVCPVCRHEGSQSPMAHHWHHLINRQRLRRYVNDQRLLPVEAFALERQLIHDYRNLLPLCAHHHLDSRAGRSALIPYELIPLGAFEFERELGLDGLLERRYR